MPTNTNGKFAIKFYTYLGGVAGNSTITVLANSNDAGTNRFSIFQGKAKGQPISIKPKVFGGEFNFYNLNQPTKLDTAAVRIILKKYNVNKNKSDTISIHTKLLHVCPEINKLYTFSIPISYNQEFSVSEPDTVLIIFASSHRFFLGARPMLGFNEKKESQLIIDSLYLSENPLVTESYQDISTNLALYPNPTSTILTIQTSLQIAKLVVYQSNGIKVLESQAAGQLDVSELPEGLYLLELWDTDGKRVVKKFEKR